MLKDLVYKCRSYRRFYENIGEAVIRYSDFEKMNEEIEDVDAKYKNPRNLCAGSVRQLNSQITASRHVHCLIFTLVEAVKDDEAVDFKNSRTAQFAWLKDQGFEVVEHQDVTAAGIFCRGYSDI